MVGYRWMPEMRNAIERSCWTDVATDEVQRELEWLRDTVNGGAWGSLPSGEIPWLLVSAVERWRDDSSDCTVPAPAIGSWIPFGAQL